MTPKTNRSSPVARLLPVVICLVALPAGVWAGLQLGSLRADPLVDRRESVAAMSPAVKERLVRRQQRFGKLKPEEQKQVRRLDNALAVAENTDELKATMSRYHRWLTMLSPTQRAELKQLGDDQQARIAKIGEYQLDLDRRAPLTHSDVEAISKWLVERIVPEEMRRRLEGIEDARDRRRAFLWYGWRRWQQGSRIPENSSEDLQALAPQLSPALSKRLENATEPEDKQRLVARWVSYTVMGTRMRRGSGGMSRFSMPEVSEEDLMQFFEDDLDEQRRQELVGLPRQERNHRLRMYYLRDKRPDWPMKPPRGPGGFRPDGKRPDGPRNDRSRHDGPPGGPHDQAPRRPGGRPPQHRQPTA